MRTGSPLGLHRVLQPRGVLPQAAEVLDARPELWDDEVRVDVSRLNLDAASFHQLRTAAAGDPDAVRASVVEVIRRRGKMHNPVTGSGGMLLGTVAEVGPASPLGLAVGQRVATLVSLTLTPLAVTDALAGWDGRSEQVPAAGHAVLFGRSLAAAVPADLPEPLVLAAFDVCGAPALTDRVVRRSTAELGRPPRVLVIGAGGKSGSCAAAAARRAGAGTVVGVVPTAAEATRLRAAGLCDEVVEADARDAVALAAAVGEAAHVTVLCVDVPGCEHGAILATAPGGSLVLFSMATDFAAAALGAEGLAADVTMLIGNGYVPGHAAFALDLIRGEPALRQLLAERAAGPGAAAAAAGAPAAGAGR